MNIMPKTLITEQQVINTAKLLVINCKPLTVASVRLHLGTHGSDSTIHKYLKKWKEECLKKAATALAQNTGLDTQLKVRNDYDFLEEKDSLIQALNRKTAQIEHYAQQLIDAEKANIDLKEKIHQLESDITKLQYELTEVKSVKNNLAQINKEMQNKLDINRNEAIQKMQITIDDLRLELKTLSETSINALRETSNQGHEALMQERVVSINLQAKIDSLTKELLESKKQSHEAIMVAQVQNRSLTRQNDQLQKIIQEHCLDKLPQLEEGLSLQFSKKVAAYGK